MPFRYFAGFLCVIGITAAVDPDALAADPPKRLLLIAGNPDGHPPQTHEYVAGVKILHELLQERKDIVLRTVVADDDWTDGPDLLDGSDGAVLFRSEGAKWCSVDEKRLAAFRRLAERRGGVSVLHWGMGTRAAEPVVDFTSLFGACHGGPDRKYRVLEAKLTPVAAEHPVTRGIMPLTIRDEFYYALKLPESTKGPQSLMEVTIDEKPYMVGWAWDRPDGGRSFGFSGMHFHENWQRPEYRTLVKQGVLWTLKLPN